MKFKVMIKDEDERKEIEAFLKQHQIMINEDASYIITQANYEHLPCKDKDGMKCLVACNQIYHLQSFDHLIEIITENDVYTTSTPLSKLEERLPDDFIRISSSNIVSRKAIQSIYPTFKKRFILILKNHQKVTVTKSYYDTFRKFLGI